MRLIASLILIAASILLVVVAPATAFLMACVLCIATLLWERSLVAVFFLFAAVHCILGYFTASHAEDSIYWLSTGHDLWFRKATFAIALGLFAMATGYRLCKQARPTWINRLVIDEDRLRNVTRAVILISAAAMFYLYAGFSVIDLVLQNVSDVGRLRYLGSETATDAYLVIRVSDALSFTLPLLWLIRRRRLDSLLCLLGFVALLLPLRRAALFSVFIVPFLLKAETLSYRKLAIVLLIFLLIFAASQIALLSFTENDAATSLASALSEVRDLGWAMELIHGNYLNGVSLIQPLDPFPGLIDQWKNTHSIAYITAELLNVDPESRSFGGLRITLAGEAFLNFWFFGPVICGILLGFATAWVERAMRYADTLAIRYLATMFFVWVCLWLYLGGTQAVATLKFGVVVLFAVYFLSRHRAVPAVATSLQPAVP